MPDYQATKIQGETLSTSTTYATLGIKSTYDQFILYQPSTDFRLALNPALIGAVFFDSSASSGSQYNQNGGDLVRNLADRNIANGTGTLLDSSTADTDFLYLCFSAPVRGTRVVIGSANATASTVLKGEYRKNDGTWADLSVTDGTIGSGKTLVTTGDVTWTAVTDWKRAQLIGPHGIISNDVTGELGATTGFWMRYSWDTVLTADVEIDEIWAINQDTNYGYFRAGVEYTFSPDRSQIGAIEVDLASGTDTMQITWIRTVH